MKTEECKIGYTRTNSTCTKKKGQITYLGKCCNIMPTLEVRNKERTFDKDDEQWNSSENNKKNDTKNKDKIITNKVICYTKTSGEDVRCSDEELCYYNDSKEEYVCGQPPIHLEINGLSYDTKNRYEFEKSNKQKGTEVTINYAIPIIKDTYKLKYSCDYGSGKAMDDENPVDTRIRCFYDSTREYTFVLDITDGYRDITKKEIPIEIVESTN